MTDRLYATIGQMIVLWFTRLFCRHTWVTMKKGWWIDDHTQVWAAELQSCPKCGAISVITAELGPRKTKFKDIQRCFAPEVHKKGEENVTAYRIDLYMGGTTWCRYEDEIHELGIAIWKKEQLERQFPEMSFKIVVDRLDPWLSANVGRR